MMVNGLLKRSLEMEIDDIQKLVDYYDLKLSDISISLSKYYEEEK